MPTTVDLIFYMMLAIIFAAFFTAARLSARKDLRRSCKLVVEEPQCCQTWTRLIEIAETQLVASVIGLDSALTLAGVCAVFLIYAVF